MKTKNETEEQLEQQGCTYTCLCQQPTMVLTIAEILNRYLSLLRKPLVQIKTNFEYEAFFFSIPIELTI
jgi:hypothetical protein